MKLSKWIKSMLIVAASALAITQVQAMEVADVKLDDVTRVANANLKLNGAGVRYKLLFKVYVAGLYLPEKKNSTTDILALKGPRRISLTFLRTVTSDAFSKSFLDGLRNNTTAEERASIFNQMLAFGQMFGTHNSLKEGDSITVDWIPDTGTVVSINGKRIADPLPDETFYNALLKIWLGDKPADSSLKTQLLGMAK